MQHFSLLKSIFKKHRWQLLLTYVLFSLEMIGALLRPYFLGKAVDGLIYGDNTGLIQLIIIHFSWVVVGMIRQRFDTRTYSAIYASVVTNFINKKIKEADISKLSAHSNLAREFVDFLEFDLVYVIEAIFNLFGSLLMLCFYDFKVVIICLIILIPVSIISFFYGKKMRKLSRNKNDELEKQVDIITTRNTASINRHYTKLRIWQIKISDQEAWNFGLMELMVIVVIGSSLYVTSWVTHKEEIAAGSLIGIYNYILKFVSGLDTIPYTVQRLSNLSDITRRIQYEEEGIEEVEVQL